MGNKLHIVCLDAPSPADYGGAIDMYYKIKALAETGRNITLHYFDYKPGRSAAGLEKYCSNVYAYNRKTFLQTLSFSKPHIVASRINRQLVNRLNADNNPVLIEGVHCTGIIPFLRNKNRKVIVRLHNDEAIYYKSLAKTETNFFKTAYYTLESMLLHRYQKTLPTSISYAALSGKDATIFQQEYGLKDVFSLPPFTPWQEATSLSGKGTYCLYHGNLAVAENEAAALWLIQNVFSEMEMPLLIAGKNISGRLLNAAKQHQHIQLKINPTENDLSELITHAHINVLPDFNKTGVKLKLLHALFCGRFCITHPSEFEQSDTIAVAQTPQEYMGFIKSFMNQTFTERDKTSRQQILRLYNNKINAPILNARLY